LDILKIGSKPGYISIGLKSEGQQVVGCGINLYHEFERRMQQFGIPIQSVDLEMEPLLYPSD